MSVSTRQNRPPRGGSWPVRRGLAVAASLAVPLVVGFTQPAQAVPVCSSTAPAAGSAVTCTVSGSAVITVPAGSTSATVTVAGGGGGGGYGGSSPGDGDGGAGAQVTGTLDLTGLTSISVVVGAGGSGRVNQNVMSTGGAYSALLDGSTPLVVAGGGGGGGAAFRGGNGAAAATAAGGNGDGDSGTMPGRGGSAGTGGLAGGGSGSTGGAAWSAGGAGGTTNGGGGGGSGYGGGGAGKAFIYESGGGAGGSYAAGAVTGPSYAPSGGAGGTARPVGTTTGTSPSGATGTVTITFSAPPVSVSAVTPTQGPTAGGTAVTVTGGPFAGGSTVTVGGQACTSMVVASASSLSCQAPAHGAGTVDVVVTSGGQSATLPNAYTYVAAPGAPTGAVATAGTSSVAVSWTAPTGGGPVVSYRVSTAQGAATCTTTTTTCVLGGTAGTAYDVTVVAVGPGGESAGAAVSSAAVTAPVVGTAVPTDALLTLTTDKGLITRAVVGQDIVIIGTGFAPYSTATIVIYSSPQVLGTVVTDGNGDFSKPVTVPGLNAGSHDLIAYGVDPQGGTRSLRMVVTVSDSTGATLANTGFSAGLPLGLGALLLAGGAALTVAGRRRGARP